MPIVQLPKGRLISMAELTSITAAGYQPDARTYTVIDHQHPAAKGTYSPQQQVKGMHRVALVMAINDGTVKARSLFTGVVYGEREPIDSDWERTSKAYGVSYREAVKFCELVEIDVDESTPQAIIPSPAPVEAVGASSSVEPGNASSVDRGWIMKKGALIRKHEHKWKTMKRDFQDASANGLSRVAKAPAHGEWFETAALHWAEQRGKLTREQEQDGSNLETVWAGKLHKSKG